MSAIKLAMVGFIDLLGFSERVQSLKTRADVFALDQDLMRVQRWFGHKPTDPVDRASHRIVSKKVSAFSDCIVLSVPTDSALSDYEGDLDIFLNELHSMALGQGEAAVNGIFLRGGVDLGIWYRRKDRLISPALINAYHLEQDASAPIITLSGEFVRHMKNHPQRRSYFEKPDPVDRLIGRSTRLPNGKSPDDRLPVKLSL